MLAITPTISIPDAELHFEFVRASGPGGQHVNKSSTAVQLRFDVANSPSIPHGVRRRLLKLAGSRISNDGVLIILSKEQRSQLQNREAALRRLRDLVLEATKRPKTRKKTKPSRAAKQRRLDAKKQHSNKKRNRASVNRNEY